MGDYFHKTRHIQTTYNPLNKENYMSFSMNEVKLIGNLGSDPDERVMPNGSSVVNFTVATTRQWKDDNKQTQERTEWHRLAAYGRNAEIICEFLDKGSQAYFEGYLQTRQWTDKDSNDKYTTEIIVEKIGLLGKGTAK